LLNRYKLVKPMFRLRKKLRQTEAASGSRGYAE